MRELGDEEEDLRILGEAMTDDDVDLVIDHGAAVGELDRLHRGLARIRILIQIGPGPVPAPDPRRKKAAAQRVVERGARLIFRP